MYTEKERAIRSVLLQRVWVVDELLKARPDHPDRQYYEGKREGYMQAFALVGESLESINVELEETI